MATRGSTQLSKRLIEAIAKNVSGGNTLRAACALTNTPLSTFFFWLREARDLKAAIEAGTAPRPQERTPRQRRLLELLERIQKSEAEAEKYCVSVVLTKAKDNWQAAAWWLERRRPGEFSLKREITPEDDGMAGKVVRSPAEIADAMDETIGAPDE